MFSSCVDCLFFKKTPIDSLIDGQNDHRIDGNNPAGGDNQRVNVDLLNASVFKTDISKRYQSFCQLVFVHRNSTSTADRRLLF
jgi:hypothetical protein